MEKFMQSVNIDNLFSAIEKETIGKIYNAHKEMFEMAKQVYRFASSALPKGAKVLTDQMSLGSQVHIMALYVQAIRVFKSIIIMCAVGQNEEAMILFRTLVDNISYLLYISEEDYDGRTDYYIHSLNLSRMDAVRKGEEVYPDLKGMVDKDGFLEREKDALSYFKKKHGTTDIKKIKKQYTLSAHIASERLKDYKQEIQSVRKILHKQGSRIAHAENPERFIYVTQNKGEATKLLIKIAPSGDMIDVSLRLSTLLFFSTINRIHQTFKLGEEQEIQSLYLKIQRTIKKEDDKL